MNIIDNQKVPEAGTVRLFQEQIKEGELAYDLLGVGKMKPAAIRAYKRVGFEILDTEFIRRKPNILTIFWKL